MDSEANPGIPRYLNDAILPAQTEREVILETRGRALIAALQTNDNRLVGMAVRSLHSAIDNPHIAYDLKHPEDED